MELSDLRWPWAVPIVAAGVLLLMLWWTRRPARRRPSDALVLAHTARLRTLPRYRALLRRRRTSGLLLTLAALCVIAGSALVLSRPQAIATEERTQRSRDLMICLDASASMDDENLAVVAQLRHIVDGLAGDRVGMVIWSGAAVQVFPLTDDYDYVRSQLDRAEAAFSGHPHGFYAGVDLLSKRASLIGDGIASCVDRFDRPASERTRAIIVSSDNDPVGEPSYSLPQAAAYAAQRHVLVYGIGASSLAAPDRSAARQELADAATATGGTFEVLGSADGAQRIVDRIDDLEKARAVEPPRRISYDTPWLGLVVSSVGVGLLLLAWGVGWRLTPRRSRHTSGAPS